jgi:hypothetical protein
MLLVNNLADNLTSQYSVRYLDCPPERYKSVLSLLDWFPYNASKLLVQTYHFLLGKEKGASHISMTHALLRSQYSIFISYLLNCLLATFIHKSIP